MKPDFDKIQVAIFKLPVERKMLKSGVYISRGVLYSEMTARAIPGYCSSLYFKER